MPKLSFPSLPKLGRSVTAEQDQPIDLSELSINSVNVDLSKPVDLRNFPDISLRAEQTPTHVNIDSLLQSFNESVNLDQSQIEESKEVKLQMVKALIDAYQRGLRINAPLFANNLVGKFFKGELVEELRAAHNRKKEFRKNGPCIFPGTMDNPVVAFSGLSSSTYPIVDMLEKINRATGSHAVGYPLRGHETLSRRVIASTTHTEWENHQRMVIDSYKNPVIGIAHSTSCIGLVKLAHKNPERFKKLILIAPAFGLKDKELIEPIDMLIKELNKSGNIKKTLSKFLYKNLTVPMDPKIQKTAIEREKTARELESPNYKNLPVSTIISFRRWMLDFQELLSVMEDFSVPTLILRGDKDYTIDGKLADCFNSLSENINQVIMEKSGHNLVLGAESEESNNHILNFIG